MDNFLLLLLEKLTAIMKEGCGMTLLLPLLRKVVAVEIQRFFFDDNLWSEGSRILIIIKKSFFGTRSGSLALKLEKGERGGELSIREEDEGSSSFMTLMRVRERRVDRGSFVFFLFLDHRLTFKAAVLVVASSLSS
jgi:hypothetical protein